LFHARPIPYSLTNICQSGTICDGCSIPLKLSTWKNENVFYSISKYTNKGFLCTQCATSKNRRTKVTIADLDNYLYSKLNKIFEG